MSQVVVRIFEQSNSAARSERVLLRTVTIQTSSEKVLNGKRVAQLLLRNFPEFACAGRVMLIETNAGWEASRIARQSKGCSYHYIWEHVVVAPDGK